LLVPFIEIVTPGKPTLSLEVTVPFMLRCWAKPGKQNINNPKGRKADRKIFLIIAILILRTI